MRNLVLLFLTLFVPVVAYAAGPTTARQSLDTLVKAANNADVEELIKKANHGDAEASLELGLGYISRKRPNIPEALKWLQKAGDEGDARGYDQIGDLYMNGIGVKKDEIEASKWCRKAADLGDPESEGLIGLSFFDGTYGQKKDTKEAFRWFTKGAKQGDGLSQFELGNMYYWGLGVKKNYEEAYYWFSLARNHIYGSVVFPDDPHLTKEQISIVKKRIRESKKTGTPNN